MATKAPSKKQTKTALLKAQENLRAEMVSTAGRTASGRQRRPTEKETYRSKLYQAQHECSRSLPCFCLTVLKARRGEERQNTLETKMKKLDLKALRTTYQTHPEVFDSEPAGLLSDVDRDEDSMVSVLFVQALHVTHNYIIVFGPLCTYKTIKTI
jgi:hypothetical protein